MRFGVKTHKPLFYSNIYNRRILRKRLTLTLPRLGSRVRIPSPAPIASLSRFTAPWPLHHSILVSKRRRLRLGKCRSCVITMVMNPCETILLLMPDTARRMACFAALAVKPQRIVRGFANPRDLCEALASVDQGCLLFDQPAMRLPGFDDMLRPLAARPAMFALATVAELGADDAMTLLRCPRCDILTGGDDVMAIAERIDALMPLVAKVGARWQSEQQARAALAQLSPREAMVLAELAAGRTSKDIARTLGISPRTIEVHRASIMRRTGTTTLAELLRLHFLAELPVAPLLARAA